MSFRDIALPLAERGFRVFPLIPKQKRPFKMEGDYDHFDAATTDSKTIEEWNEQVRDANVGLCPDENFCFLETDDLNALKEECKDLSHEIWETSWAGARPNRCYFIFRQTMRTRKAGNMTLSREGKENLFEFKQHRVYVVGPGSIHPCGLPYVATWAAFIPPMPDVLLNRLCELAGAPKATSSAVMSSESKEGTATLDRFLDSHGVATVGDWFNKGKSWYRPIECPWNDVHENTNQGTSTCVVFTEGGDGGYGFDCKHRCADRDWKTFRAHLESLHPDVQFTFVPESESVGTVTLGGETTNDAAIPERLPRPRYPDGVWDGTLYGEFADLCARDNFIPRKFFSESLRTVTGSIVGDCLSCTLDGVNPRAYTIKIAGPGAGKGTSDDRVRQLFGGLTTAGAMLFGPKDFAWRNTGIGAQIVNPASAPGLMAALEGRKLKKGETPDPLETWQPMARFITMSEEVRGLFANFANESTGAGLESVLCELYDRCSFSSTATKDRAPASGQLMFGLLGGITKEGWDGVFGAVESTESGFLSRVNIIGTEESRTVAGLEIPDFEPLRRRFFPLITDLIDHPRRLRPAPAAMQLVHEWFSGLELAEGISRARLNIHAWRSALHRAWLRGHDSILEDDADAGIQLAEYQGKMREWYAPPEGRTLAAQTEARIRKFVRGVGKCTVRELMTGTNYGRVGIGRWNQCLEDLVRAGELRVAEEAGERGRRKKMVFLLKPSE